MYNYTQIAGGEEKWQAVPASKVGEYIAQHKPMFVTVLAVSAMSEEGMSKEEIAKLTFDGPMYFDWDGEDVTQVQPQVMKFIQKMIDLGVEVEQLKLYATGGRGFHCELPWEMWAEKHPKSGWQNLPLIFKEIAYELAVDTLDLRVYSGKRGRMWRQVNVQRDNGRYKVPITYAELQGMTGDGYLNICSEPRPEIERPAPTYAMNLALLFDKKQQKVKDMLSKRAKIKVTSNFKADMPSLQALLEGRGLKPGMGFNAIALQLAIIAASLGWAEETLVQKAEGLIAAHQSDGDRYNSESKRRADLIRMHRYMQDNPCYVPSVGGVKSLLAHAAPDLDGIPVSSEDVELGIKEAEENPSPESDEPGEYDGLAGVVLNRYGVWANTEAGLKRVCAVGFNNVEMLKSMETGTISAVEADITVNGRSIVRQALELDTFSSVSSFNKFCVRFGHGFQGTDANVRGLYMRVVESAKKSGKEFYVTAREGLDIINIPNHDNPLFREPFLIWADGRGVVLDPKVADQGLNIRFQGYPDTRGQFKMDLGDAPALVEWVKDEANKELLASVIDGMLHCQRPEAISKLVGWTVACFYRMLFHKAYGKFPLLHINAPQGTGKSEMMKAALGFFYHNQEPHVLSPSSTLFALSYSASGSTTPPLVVDEYKPHRMVEVMKEKLRLMFRDAYNARVQQRGGGTRDNDDYRALHSVTLCSPIVFIAEAIEDESAIMERVVLATLARPHPVQAARDYGYFQKWQRNSGLLAVLGQYLASHTVQRYSVETLQEEFDILYNAAKQKYMLTAANINDTQDREALIRKQNTRERTVYNFTVAEFGFTKFAELVNAIFKDGRFKVPLANVQAGIYTRMDDLAATTQPEWMKVMNTFCDMANLEENDPCKLIPKRDYAVVDVGGDTALEVYVRVAYNKYRMYCRKSGVQPLYSGDTAFMHGLRDCPVRITNQSNVSLQVPGGSSLFSMDGLTSAGFQGIHWR